jgi:tetratricopeptide (TPR) repeat protein
MPGGVLALIAGIAGGAVVFFICLRWWADGMLSPAEAVIVFAFYGGMVFGVFVSIGHPALLTVTLLVLAGSLSWVVYQHQKFGVKRFYKDKIRIYEAAIRADPSNSASRISMAEAYFAIGDLDRAIGALELAEGSGRFSIRENHRLRDWREQREMRDSKTIGCPLCHCRNVWGNVKCRVCDRPIDYANISWWDRSGNTAAKRRILAAAGIWLAVLVLTASLPFMRSWIVIACVTMAEAGWLMIASK